eukprot:GHVN01074014.1.p1 GENE.GHVN01074014.1~~GHVN01074014.1.p1  ORF type:complete len:1200 (+),score=133.20 GHVN01074014.1:1304-4903(+)
MEEPLSARVVKIGSPQASEYAANRVRTAKYTQLTFLPLFLADQFTRPANIYFLYLATLQTIPAITITSGMPTMMIPISIIMVFTALQDAFEDYKRHQADKALNQHTTHRLRRSLSKEGETEIQIVEWQHIKVGDLVVVRNREMVPADLILLDSSGENRVALIETSNLDGESTLKYRAVPQELGSIWGETSTFQDVLELEGSLVCDTPNEALDRFHGRMTAQTTNSQCVEVVLTLSNIMLRGCTLRNTEWAVGVVVYAGHDAKIFQNSCAQPFKRSKLVQWSNRALVYLLIILLIICSGFAAWTYQVDSLGDFRMRPYLRTNPREQSLLMRALWGAGTWQILVGGLIPISLYFNLSLSRTIQSAFLVFEPGLKDEVTGKQIFEVRSSDCNDDAGQVGFVFSDKTGTLTENHMVFSKCCIKGRRYGDDRATPDDSMLIETPHVEIIDESLKSHVGVGDTDTVRFFIHMAVNHTVFLENGNQIAPMPVYSASSADEAALVYAAAHFGIILRGQIGNVLTVNVFGEDMEILIMAKIDFTSERKRTSVLCMITDIKTKRWTDDARHYAQDTIFPTGYVVFCKGADNKILERSRQPSNENQEESEVQRGYIDKALEDYGKSGLRTLAFACRHLGEHEVLSWLERYKVANANQQQTALDELVDELEGDLDLQGVTGIEDKLQEGVTDTIRILRKAGIAVWILTGDKLETAVNVGYQCGLIDDYTDVITFQSPIHMGEKMHDAVQQRRSQMERGDRLAELCVVIDCACLDEALTESKVSLFLDLVELSKSVICCRATPAQKAMVVQLMKKNTDKVTLAIGDGGNDCNMIQTADVGVGVRGSEGMQAVNVSDYSVKSFSALKPLILVYGRWWYRSTAKMILHVFYKNFLLISPQILMGVWAMGSGQKIFMESIMQLFHTFWAGLPSIVLGAIDRDTTVAQSEEPLLYKTSQNLFFNNKVFFIMMANAAWHVTVAFYVPFWFMGGMSGNVAHPQAHPLDLWTIGAVMFLIITLQTLLKATLESYSSAYIILLSGLGLLCALIVWIHVLPCMVHMPDLALVSERLRSTPIVLGVIFQAILMSFFRDWVWKIYKRENHPEVHHIIQDSSAKVKEREAPRARSSLPCRINPFDPPDVTAVNLMRKRSSATTFHSQASLLSRAANSSSNSLIVISICSNFFCSGEGERLLPPPPSELLGVSLSPVALLCVFTL